MKKAKNGKLIEECNEEYFSKINSKDKAWVLGFLYADGYISKSLSSLQIRLSLKDKEVLEKIKDFISFEGSVKEYISKCKNKEYPSCFLIINSCKLVQDLNKLGCTHKKSLTLTFPNFLDENYYSHFIRGYFDGDGSISYRETKNEAKINIKGTESFLLSLSNILKNKEMTTSFYKQKEANVFNLELCGYNNVLKFINYIYKESNDKIRMIRKVEKARHINNVINNNRKIKLRKNIIYETINIK